MNFKSVLKIDEDDLIEDKEGASFITKENLEKMLRQQEYKLLYFVKKSDYITFHDFPALGASKDELVRSSVYGPFDSFPTIQDNEEPFHLVLPSGKIPDFEAVKLVKVHLGGGIALDGKINYEKLQELEEKALKRLQSFSQDFKVINRLGGSVAYRALFPNAVVEYEFDKLFQGPVLHLSVFGKADEPIKLEEKLNLYNELKGVFKNNWDIELGLSYCLREGVAYNLNLAKTDLNKLSEYDNIIL
jgi:hypothetical protein